MKWFKSNKLSLNLNKTVSMHFWSNDSKLKLTIDNFNIPVVLSTKFLGVHIDNQLTWHPQVQSIIEKQQKAYSTRQACFK